MIVFLLLSLYFVELLGFFGIGLLVALRQKTAVHRNFAIFSTLVGFWQLMQFLAQVVANHHLLAVAFLRGSVVVSGVMSASFMAFAFSHARYRVNYGLVYGLGLLVGLITLFSRNLQLIEITHKSIGVPKLDLWYGVLLVFAFVGIFISLAAIFVHFRKTSSAQERSQDKIILSTVVIMGFFVLLASFDNSVFSNSIFAQHLIPFTCLVSMTSFLYAIIYKGLFDIHFFVVRAAAYLSTLLVITFIFVIPIMYVLTRLLNVQLTRPLFVVLILSSVLSIYILQYMRKIFDKITAKIFFRNYYDPQEVIDRVSGVLVRNVEPTVLRQQTARILTEALKPEFIHFLLLDAPNDLIKFLVQQFPTKSSSNIVIADELDPAKHTKLIRELRQHRIATVVKLRTTHEDLGFLALGYRQSGEPYSMRDRRLLSIVSDEIAIALQNSLRFQQIENFNVTLQQKVNAATHKLRITNEKLKALDETKDEFISMASHQLRTPLTSVKGYVSMVLEGDAGAINDMQRKLLDQAFISAQRMVFLIADLLNVSRLKTGKFVIEKRATNLADLVEDEVSQLRGTAEARNLKLFYDKPAKLPLLMLDETKIRQVVMNFIDNAIYYTAPGGEIHVILADTGETVELSVQDTGMGVPKHDQHRLFTKFYRANNAKKARPDGTGLGLFMAKRVIVEQGGAIIFKSQEGKGSTFGFTFPKTKLLADERSARAPKMSLPIR